MTASNIDVLAVSPGSGSSVTQPIPGVFYKDSDIKLYLITTVDGNTTETLLTLGTDYTISKTKVSGTLPVVYSGSITTTGNVSLDDDLAAMVWPVNEQLTNFKAIPHDPAMYERQLDLAAVRDQSTLEILKRSVRLPLSFNGPQPILGGPIEGKALIWRGGNLVAEIDAANIAAAGPNADAAALSAAQAALYDGVSVDDTTALKADTALTYTTGQPGEVEVGSYVLTKQEGYAYQVAASDETDHHISTAGGVKLFAMPIGTGNNYALEQFGWDFENDGDASPALSKVLDVLIALGSGALIVTALARLDSRVSKALPQNVHISILFSGNMATGFSVNNTDGGLQFTSIHRNCSVRCDNGLITPLIDGAGTALEISFDPGGSQDQRMSQITNMVIQERDDTSAFSFNDPIKCTGLYRPMIWNNLCSQGTGATTIIGKVLDITACYKPSVIQNYFKSKTDQAEYGIYFGGTNEEGFFVLGNALVGPKRGFFSYKSDGREPEGFFEDNHCNNSIYGAEFNGNKYIQVCRNLMYAGSTAISTYTDFRLTNAEGFIFRDNIYRQPFATDRIHIDLWPGGSATPGAIVEDIFIDERGLYGTAARHVNVRDNVKNVEIIQPDRDMLSDEAFVSYPNPLTFVSSTGTERILIQTPKTLNGRIRSESGTFTPELKINGVTTGITYLSREGRFTVYGDMVSGQVKVFLSSKGTEVGDVTLDAPTGLPGDLGLVARKGSGKFGYHQSMASLPSWPMLFLSNATTIALVRSGAASHVSLTNANFTDASSFDADFTFFLG